MIWTIIDVISHKQINGEEWVKVKKKKKKKPEEEKKPAPFCVKVRGNQALEIEGRMRKK